MKVDSEKRIGSIKTITCSFKKNCKGSEDILKYSPYNYIKCCKQKFKHRIKL